LFEPREDTVVGLLAASSNTLSRRGAFQSSKANEKPRRHDRKGAGSSVEGLLVAATQRARPRPPATGLAELVGDTREVVEEQIVTDQAAVDERRASRNRVASAATAPGA